MIKFDKESKITEIKKSASSINKKESNKKQQKNSSTMRPYVVDAKVYKVKSAFVKNSVFITLSYIETSTGRKPIEIFINSKDLNRAPEYVVLTRLISAIFRRATDPMFILEELHGIHDPNGGSFREGKYYHSFYAEVAETIERFFYDVGIIKKENNQKVKLVKEDTQTTNQVEPVEIINENRNLNAEFKLCPDCSSKSLKIENGCDMCVECGYSKCDK
jgi:ribonucleoside-diphosphate reductase alpha chain